MEPKPCETCIEYIKKMKGLEFRLQDLIKERETKSANSQRLQLISEADQVNEVLRIEVDRQRKKNEVSEAVIAQLKRELEKYAYEVIKLQELMQSARGGMKFEDGQSFGIISETFREEEEDEEFSVDDSQKWL